LRLLPRADGAGRVVACEVAIVDQEIRDMIVDPSRTRQIASYVGSGKGDEANRTFEQHLKELVSEGTVDEEVANIVNAGTPSTDGASSSRRRNTARAASR
jgi:twitching motility protein PilT